MLPDSKYIDEIYHFKGAWEVPSFCELKIISKPVKTIIITTELYESNPGTSVTSWVDKLATELIQKFKINPDQLTFIVHNPDRKSNLEFFKETFDIVSFEWKGEKFINPSWKRITKQELDFLIS
jgi:hypothetical protein